MEIGFALCGSFCTYAQVFPVMEALAKDHQITPIFSYASAETDSRFGTADDHLQRVREICGRSPLRTIAGVEPIGPKKLLDALIIAPCTGNTLAKLAHSIADTPVTMAAKSHLRNGRPVIIAVSTNDALAGESCWPGSTTISYPSVRMTPSRSPPAWWPTLQKSPKRWKPRLRENRFSHYYYNVRADRSPPFLFIRYRFHPARCGQPHRWASASRPGG